MTGNMISLKVTSNADDEDLYSYNCFHNVHAEILYGPEKKKIGHIAAVLVNRQAIPEKCFYQAFDEHSAEMQWVGCTLMENRYGRTSLLSLADTDSDEFDFMYISVFHVDADYKQNGNSDVGAEALYQFLRHPEVNPQVDDAWSQVCNVAYVLDATEAMTPTELHEYQYREKRTGTLDGTPLTGVGLGSTKEAERMDTLERMDANQFLRNGFFQDAAIAKGKNRKILVASLYNKYREPLKSHAQVSGIQFASCLPEPSAQEAAIQEATVRACSNLQFHSDQQQIHVADLRRNLNSFQSRGGSLTRSHCLHSAVANNCLQVVQMILELEPATINGIDTDNLTPLMIAAQSAAGRTNQSGLDDTSVIEYLLQRGADKNLTDPLGMTAYGHYKKASKEFTEMLRAMTGNPKMTRPVLPSLLQVEAFLCPQTGPTTADKTGGKGANSGLKDYSAEDMELDREMGILHDGDY